MANGQLFIVGYSLRGTDLRGALNGALFMAQLYMEHYTWLSFIRSATVGNLGRRYVYGTYCLLLEHSIWGHWRADTFCKDRRLKYSPPSSSHVHVYSIPNLMGITAWVMGHSLNMDSFSISKLTQNHGGLQ